MIKCASLLVGLALFLTSGLTAPVQAQTAQQYWQCRPQATGVDPGWCPVSAANPMPTTGGGGGGGSSTVNAASALPTLTPGSQTPQGSLAGATYVQPAFGTASGGGTQVDATHGLPTDVKASVLPTGASTAAKQPALGTAGSASADVQTMQGAAGSNAAASGNPIAISGTAGNAEPTLAANGQNATLFTDLAHKLIVAPYANPENLVQGTTAAMTGTTSTSLVAAPGAGLHNYITNLTCVNSHATVGTFITVQDGSGGTALYTVAAGAVYGGSTMSLPAPLRQPTANTALFVANVTTGANVICSASGYKGQ